MRVSINIRVVDNDWVRLEKEHPEYINPYDLKYKRYIEWVSFDFDSDILEYKANRNASYDLPIRYYDNETNTTVDTTCLIDGLTLIEFIDERGTNRVIVSNELITRFLGAQKKGRTYYWYLYVDGESDYTKLTHHVWLSSKSIDQVLEKYPNTSLVIERQVNLLRIEGRM